MQAFKAEFSTDGTDWDYIPYDMYLFGGGGIAGWGTLCGIPNGCVALLNLIGLHGALGGEVLGHYSGTEFPTDQVPDLYNDAYYGTGGTGGYTWVKQPVPDGEVLAHTTSYSPLCHVSISKWCYAAGVDLNDLNTYGWTHKNDRCAKICADMAAYTAQLINDWAVADGVVDEYDMPYQTAQCRTCHPSYDGPPGSPAQHGKMDCVQCHTEEAYMNGPRIIVESVWTSDPTDSGHEFDPVHQFQPTDDIRYNVHFFVCGTKGCTVKTKGARAKGPDDGSFWKTKLQKEEVVHTGDYTWYWDETVPAGADVGTTANVKIGLRGDCYDATVKGKCTFDIV